MDVVVIGAGPAGVVAATRAAELGARVALVTRGEFGGMAANDGPVPVRTLAYAAHLLREARQLGRYGVTVGEPTLDYPRLLARVREVVEDARLHSTMRGGIDRAGVAVHEHAGTAHFLDPRTVETESGLKLRGDRIILCVGGASRRLAVPGVELTATHSDAWSLTAVPPSLIVVGAGMTGMQVASIFHAFGSRVQLFQKGPRILPDEDEDVSAAVASAFRAAGMVVRESYGTVDSFEKSPSGVRMNFSKDGVREAAEATLVVLTVGWVANTAGLDLPAAGVETDARGFIRVDESLQTTAPGVFAAGDITGRLLLVPQAIQDGFLAATNAVRGPGATLGSHLNPIGGFTDPEYAHVGLTEAKARATHDVEVVMVHFHETVRTIVDGRTSGFCKLIVDRRTLKILGCHVVGERAVDIVQVVAIVIAAGLRVDELARIPLSFPTYTGILTRAAFRAVEQLGLEMSEAAGMHH